jgi:hypothetical protein
LDFKPRNTQGPFGALDAEYAAALEGCAVADLSTFGRIEVTGTDRLDLLHRLSTNDLAGAQAGEVRSTAFLTDKGRIIDRVLLVIRESSVMMITSPGAEAVLTHWIRKYTITEDVSLAKVTDSTAMFCLLGPMIDSPILRLRGSHVPGNRWVPWPAGERGALLAMRTESRDRFALLLASSADAEKVWGSVALPGVEGGCRPIGSIAYDAYRISRGIPARPGELAERHTPYDAGIREDISFTKGCYIGQEVVARLDTYQKVRRRLVGVAFRESAPGEPGQALLKGGVEVGELTSALKDRVMGKFLGLAVVADAEAHPGDEVVAAGTHARGTIMPLPMNAAAA